MGISRQVTVDKKTKKNKINSVEPACRQAGLREK